MACVVVAIALVATACISDEAGTPIDDRAVNRRPSTSRRVWSRSVGARLATVTELLRGEAGERPDPKTVGQTVILWAVGSRTRYASRRSMACWTVRLLSLIHI